MLRPKLGTRKDVGSHCFYSTQCQNSDLINLITGVLSQLGQRDETDGNRSQDSQLEREINQIVAGFENRRRGP